MNFAGRGPVAIFAVGWLLFAALVIFGSGIRHIGKQGGGERATDTEAAGRLRDGAADATRARDVGHQPQPAMETPVDSGNIVSENHHNTAALAATIGATGARDAIATAVASYTSTGSLKALREALLEAARINPADAMAALSSLPISDRLKIDIGAEMLGTWTRSAPREAAAWAQQNRWTAIWGGPVAKVAEEWARQDPATALGWAEGLSEGLDRMSALSAAVSRWSKTDFASVADYVTSRQRGSARDVMAATLAYEFGQENPAAGLQWALDLDDSAGRERAAAGALAGSYASDPERAAALLRSTGQPEQFEKAVLDRLAGPSPWWK